MKVYISVDMEGITGICNNNFLMDNQPEYTRGRKLMMQDLNAAIEGAIEGGATEVLVNDAHGSMRNLMIEDLHEAADLVTGFPKNNLMMSGINQSFDAAMFIGFHAMYGSEGVLSHTINSGVINDIKLNNKSYGETGLNAAIAGYFNIPVVMISGDDILKKEALEILPNVEFALTKERQSFLSAKMINPKKARILIKEKAKNGLLKKDSIDIFNLEGKLKLEITVKNPAHADVIEIIPGVRRISPLKVVFNAENILQVNNLITTVSNACCILSIGIY